MTASVPSCRVRRPLLGGCRGAAGRVPWWRGAIVGVLTGLTSLVVVVAPVVLAWLVEPLSIGDGWQAAGTGAALWLLVSGGHLAIGEVTISVVPLLGLALLSGGLARRARGDGRRVHRR